MVAITPDDLDIIIQKRLEDYEKAIRNYFGVLPLKVPNVGQYLMLPSKRKRSVYNLLEFFNLTQKISADLT